MEVDPVFYKSCLGIKKPPVWHIRIHLEALRCEAFPCFNLLEQNQSCNLFRTCVLIHEEESLVGASSRNFVRIHIYFVIGPIYIGLVGKFCHILTPTENIMFSTGKKCTFFLCFCFFLLF